MSSNHFNLPPSLQELKVLVVEDNDVNALLLEHLLNEWGITKIEFAVNGKTSIAKAKENNFDIILMDIHMPEMNGIEATKKIREFNSSVIIIAISASHSVLDITQAKAAGCHEYIFKPVLFKVLQETIAKHISILYSIQEKEWLYPK